jgi:hypothetical protein
MGSAALSVWPVRIRRAFPTSGRPRKIERLPAGKPFACGRLSEAPNARAVRQRKTQAILAIVLRALGDESHLHSHDVNPQKLSHNAETAENPPRVWTFKKLEPV